MFLNSCLYISLYVEQLILHMCRFLEIDWASRSGKSRVFLPFNQGWALTASPPFSANQLAVSTDLTSGHTIMDDVMMEFSECSCYLAINETLLGETVHQRIMKTPKLCVQYSGTVHLWLNATLTKHSARPKTHASSTWEFIFLKRALNYKNQF